MPRAQEFPIWPDPDNPRACNVYSELKFPDGVYEDIQEYYEERAAASANWVSKEHGSSRRLLTTG